MAYFLIYISLGIICSVTANPCTNYKPFSNTCKRLVFNEWRESLEVPINDAYFADQDFYGSPDYTLATKPPPQQHCGTRFPIWIKDMPSRQVEGENAFVTACVIAHEYDCYYDYKIMVHFCLDFQVYKLVRSTIDSAYCLNPVKRLTANSNCTCKKLDGKVSCKSKFEDYCDSNLCQNGATCIDGYNSYSCKCKEGFSGKYCQNNACGNYVPFSKICKRLTQNEMRATDSPLSDSDISTTLYYGSMGYKLASDPPKPGHCGTDNPIWVKDLQTRGYYGSANTYEACVVVGDNECLKTLNITVIYCPGVHIFRLDPTEHRSAYCLTVFKADLNKCKCEKEADGTHCRDGDVTTTSEQTTATSELTTTVTTSRDPCVSYPCLNSGTCVRQADSFICKCPPLFTGRLCETEISDDVCRSNPCLNGGSCMAVKEAYTCKCMTGYIGVNCQFKEAPCSHYQNFSETCRRLGISKYKGSEIPVDDQDIERVYFGSLGFQLLGRSPRVKNWCGTIYPVWIRGMPKGGSKDRSVVVTACVVGEMSDCAMKYNVTIHFCPDLQVYELMSTIKDSAYCLTNDNSCLDSGHCMSSDVTNCQCLKDDHSDIQCNDIIDRCASQCQNGATCVNSIGGFVCKCTKGYYGKFCENEEKAYSTILVVILALCLIFLLIAVCIILYLVEMLYKKSKKHINTERTRWQLLAEALNMQNSRISELTNQLTGQCTGNCAKVCQNSPRKRRRPTKKYLPPSEHPEGVSESEHSDVESSGYEDSYTSDSSFESGINLSSDEGSRAAAAAGDDSMFICPQWGVYRHMMAGVAALQPSRSDLTPYRQCPDKVPCLSLYRNLKDKQLLRLPYRDARDALLGYPHSLEEDAYLEEEEESETAEPGTEEEEVDSAADEPFANDSVSVNGGGKAKEKGKNPLTRIVEETGELPHPPPKSSSRPGTPTSMSGRSSIVEEITSRRGSKQLPPSPPINTEPQPSKSVSKKKNADSPTTSKQNADSPTTSKQKADSPTTSKQKADSPTTSKKNADSPTTSKKNADSPTTSKKNADSPTTSKKKADSPTTSKKKESAKILPTSSKEMRVMDLINYTLMAVALPTKVDDDDDVLSQRDVTKPPPNVHIVVSEPSSDPGEENTQNSSIPCTYSSESTRVPGSYKEDILASRSFIYVGATDPVDGRSHSEGELPSYSVNKGNTFAPKSKGGHKPQDPTFTSWCAWCGSTSHDSSTCSFNESLRSDSQSGEDVCLLKSENETAAFSPSAALGEIPPTNTDDSTNNQGQYERQEMSATKGSASGISDHYSSPPEHSSASGKTKDSPKLGVSEMSSKFGKSTDSPKAGKFKESVPEAGKRTDSASIDGNVQKGPKRNRSSSPCSVCGSVDHNSSECDASDSTITPLKDKPQS